MSDKGVRVEYEVHFTRDRRARKVVRQGPPPPPTQDAVPRVARLLALAHKWEGMVRRGEVKEYADIARLFGITRARVCQICSLALLAPGLQEKILWLPLLSPGAAVLSRTVVHLRWKDQCDAADDGAGSHCG